MTKRSRQYVLVAHCCLDQNAVVAGWARARGAYPFMATLLQKGIGVLQLPCPETLALGLARPPMTYAEYNTPSHRAFCENLCVQTVSMVKKHQEVGDQLLGIIGIQHSPNCALLEQRGVFMEALLSALQKEGIDPPLLEVPVKYEEGDEKSETDFMQELEGWLERN